MLIAYFANGLWGAQCVESVLYTLETEGETKERVLQEKVG